jgi:hypothetical protein
MGSENARGCAQNAGNRFGFEFLQPYHNHGDEFLNHIVRVIDDETWVSFVNVETEELSKQWMHTYSPNKPKRCKQTSTCGKTDSAVFWDRTGVLMVKFMQQGTAITSEGNYETRKKKPVKGHSEQKAWNNDIRCSTPPSHSSTAGAFQLGVN